MDFWRTTLGRESGLIQRTGLEWEEQCCQVRGSTRAVLEKSLWGSKATSHDTNALQLQCDIATLGQRSAKPEKLIQKSAHVLLPTGQTGNSWNWGGRSYPQSRACIPRTILLPPRSIFPTLLGLFAWWRTARTCTHYSNPKFQFFVWKVQLPIGWQQVTHTGGDYIVDCFKPACWRGLKKVRRVVSDLCYAVTAHTRCGWGLLQTALGFLHVPHFRPKMAVLEEESKGHAIAERNSPSDWHFF